jgi:hypothetical protein
LRSFAQFAFFPRRFRLSRKNIFHPAGPPFRLRFSADEPPRNIARAQMRRAMTKSIVVQNATTPLRDTKRKTGLQAASLLGLLDAALRGAGADRHFRCIGV